jgi:lycopene cyclase domain-containing protein
VSERWQYLAHMAGCLLVTLPLELVFKAGVYRRWRRAVRAVAPVVVLFVVWDIVGIARDHWSYSAQYTSGLLLPARVPLEELVFFVVIPWCALLTYEAVGTVLRRGWGSGNERRSDGDAPVHDAGADHA